jgi:hypothetical protein
MIGPKHYEGWTCKDCEYLKFTTHNYCFAPSILESQNDNKIEVINHTPSWCPYIRHAILNRVLEEVS